MKHVIASRLLRGFAIVLFTLPLLAQQESPRIRISEGSHYETTARLKLLHSPPAWWSIRLNESGDSLERGTEVKVLEIRALSTLFGRDTWVHVQTVSDLSASTGRRSGWVYGGTSGETLVPTDPPKENSSGGKGNVGQQGTDD